MYARAREEYSKSSVGFDKSFVGFEKVLWVLRSSVCDASRVGVREKHSHFAYHKLMPTRDVSLYRTNERQNASSQITPASTMRTTRSV